MHRGYVNPWECDEMGHMNLQFHAAKFADALAHLGALAGIDTPRLHHAHFRFAHEMRASDLVTIRVLALATAGARVTLQFLMSNGDEVLASSQIAEVACADERSALHLQVLSGSDVPHAQAQPRAIDPALFDRTPSLARDGAAQRFETIRSVVQPADCNSDGTMGARAIMARLSECQAHMWHAAGIGRHWQTQENLATATAELGIRFHATLEAGAPLVVTSAFRIAGSKVMRFSHHMFHAASGLPVMAAEGAAVLIDRTTRRAVPMPPMTRHENSTPAGFSP